MIRVLIADDHDLFRDGLKSIFKNEKNIQVVGDVPNGALAIKEVKKTKVDVVLMDISMPEIDGIDATERILSKHPNIKIIMLTMHNDVKTIRRVIEAGAHGYLLKHSSKAKLVEGINEVCSGQTYFSNEVTEQLIKSMRAMDTDQEVVLTKREEDILLLICEERTTTQIAKILHISPNTVESHRKSLLNKTGCKNSVGLAKFAIENGLIQSGQLPPTSIISLSHVWKLP